MLHRAYAAWHRAYHTSFRLYQGNYNNLAQHFLRYQSNLASAKKLSNNKLSTEKVITNKLITDKLITRNPQKSGSSWSSLGIEPRISSNLLRNSYTQPTEIQSRAAPVLLRNSHALIAAETGAGKTYAYLLPILSRLSRAKNPMLKPASNRPGAIVLLPTRELVSQVLLATTAVSRGALAVRSYTGGSSADRTAQLRRIRNTPFDLLICTPASLTQLRGRKLVHLSAVRHVVLDEADVLLRAPPNGDFINELLPLFDSLEAKHTTLNQPAVQYVYVAASVPQDLRVALRQRHGEASKNRFEEVQTERLHVASAPSQNRTEFICVNGGIEAKFRAVTALVQERLRKDPDGKIMVFCDDSRRRESLVSLLGGLEAEIGPVSHLSAGGRDPQERAAEWGNFSGITNIGPRKKAAKAAGKDDEDGDAKVAVCAGSYGRGIDHLGVTSVILVDIPLTGVEYMHRVGRLRGQGGAVFALVSRRERPMAMALFLAHVRGERLSGICAKGARESDSNVRRNMLKHDEMVKRAKRKGFAKWIPPALERGAKRSGPPRFHRKRW